MKHLYLILFLCAFSLSSIEAQTTGAFNQTITFSEPDYNFTRTLFFYVPVDYDPNQSYKLVVGFRGGPHTNAGQFRDQLTFLSNELNAIILCPENKDHFWNEEGLMKQLYKYSLEVALQQYNIDTNYVYLTGLSYGGRHSVIVSMDTENGQIPTLRGVIPFAPGSDSHLEPDYDDIADFPPACICIGLNDNANFINVANTLQADITANGGQSFLNEIPGVGHTVDFPNYEDEMMECLEFIENQYNTSAISSNAKELTRIRLFPNPVKSLLFIDIDEEIENIQIIDLHGKVIIAMTSNQTSIDVSNLDSGLYLLQVKSDHGIITQPFFRSLD